MKRIYSMLRLFTDEKTTNLEENFNEFKLKIESKSIKIPKAEELLEIIPGFPDRDKVIIAVVFDCGDPISLSNRDSNYREFIDELKDTLPLADDDSIYEIIIKIYKYPDKENNVSIYSFESLSIISLNLSYPLLSINLKSSGISSNSPAFKKWLV